VSQGQTVGEMLSERRVVTDIAADVAHHPAEPDAQKFEFALELMGWV
jgi:hypothetical protein